MSEVEQFNWAVDPSTLVGDIGLERLKILRDFGSDRLTLGIQSLEPRVLKIMNRPHDKQVALEAIENSQNTGYQVNIEFIFGHPGETIQNWIDVMKEAVTLGTEEIQLYRLKIEAYGDYQGPIKNYIEKRPDEVVSNEETIMMKQLAIDILAENGYHENLRRGFSKKNKNYTCLAPNPNVVLFCVKWCGLRPRTQFAGQFVFTI